MSKGDLIRINVNGKSLENKPIHNGQIFRIEGFDKHGNIQIGKSKTLSKDYANFSMGYYRTAHASQGKDAQVLILSNSSNVKSNGPFFFLYLPPSLF